MRHYASMTQGSLFCAWCWRGALNPARCANGSEAAYPLLLRFLLWFLDAGGHNACHHCAP